MRKSKDPLWQKYNAGGRYISQYRWIKGRWYSTNPKRFDWWNYDVEPNIEVIDDDKLRILESRAIWWHKNCNWRHVHTSAEVLQNKFFHAYDRRLIHEKYGIEVKNRRRSWKKVPNTWDDMPISGTRSWKKLEKKKKQWM